MPGMLQEALQDAERRLGNYLSKRQGYGTPEYVDSGGSAAIFKVEGPQGVRAIKVYDSRFLEGRTAAAEKRRLKLQSDLIGHSCSTLVTIFDVEESFGTAFIEMEYVPWRQLKSVLHNVPDDKIPALLSQLIEAVTYLERREIAHRDIKPENIHVSEDFRQLKLIDLGVARELSRSQEDGPDATDHGDVRPFIATAQYSSPEYLFRLDEPSPSLWKGLSLYQVGAVLHDLIAKRPLFEAEVLKGNRWLVARAVLSKTPIFPDADPARLSSLKSLALRCLTKDLNTRLRIVDWADFDTVSGDDELSALSTRLSRGGVAASAQSIAATESRLCFDRSVYAKTICEGAKDELIHACGNHVPLTMRSLGGEPLRGHIFEFAPANNISIHARLTFKWLSSPNERSAEILLSACISDTYAGLDSAAEHALSACSLDGTPDIYAKEIARCLAKLVFKALEMIDGGAQPEALANTDLGSAVFKV